MATENTGGFFGWIIRLVGGIGKAILWVIILFFGANVVFGSFGTVGAGERGILLRFSAVTGKIYDEGLYFKFPMIESVVIIDTRIQKEQTEATAASKDLQTVNTATALNYHLDPSKVNEIFQQVGTGFRERLIDPAIQEAVKAATAKFTAEELITKREMVRSEMFKYLKEKLAIHGIIVDDVNIVNFDFSASFNKAIEEKVTAEQEALAAKNMLERIKFEAQQKIAEAEGKAKAMEIEAKALNSNPQILELRALEKWNGVLPQVTGGATPMINLANIGGK